MNLLLDTHIWLWSILEPEKIKPSVAFVLNNPENEIWLSPISVWEALILIEKGRISVNPPQKDWILNAIEKSNVNITEFDIPIVIKSRELDLPHQDPADRFIASTALMKDLTLITSDTKLLNCSEFQVLSNL
jgi:PIN domain nuclease of toxin-antitoxin system